MRLHLYRSVVVTAILLVLCAGLYPLAGWALSQAAFHNQANGSLTANGSTLIGQPWNNGTSINPHWFNGRPDPDNPLALNGVAGESGAANLGPRSKVLVAAVAALIAEWRAVGVLHPTSDLVTSSASGLDPDITLADAQVQIPMIAAARGLSTSTLDSLVHRELHGAQFDFLGTPYLNVLQLNEALATLRPS
jgi:potassium-transporting ATPase KdpC subunit